MTDETLDPATVGRLADALRAAAGPGAFRCLDEAARAVEGRGQRERVDRVRDALLGGRSFQQLADVVRRALPDPELTGVMVWPLSEAVATLACRDHGHVVDGLDLLPLLADRFTGEHALRIFLTADLYATLSATWAWTTSPRPAVRRLASEGTRPLLPGARRVRVLLQRPGVTRPVLEALRDDPDEDVRRSVANHLNDLGRLDPDLAVEIATGWADTPSEHTPGMLRRGLRTLVKEGDQRALALLGITDTAVEVTDFSVGPGRVRVGDTLHLEATVSNLAPVPARIAVDYVVHFRAADGRLVPRVFKLGILELPPGGAASLSGRRRFRSSVNRVFHPGRHAVQLQVNGQRRGWAEFELLV